MHAGAGPPIRPRATLPTTKSTTYPHQTTSRIQSHRFVAIFSNQRGCSASFTSRQHDLPQPARLGPFPKNPGGGPLFLRRGVKPVLAGQIPQWTVSVAASKTSRSSQTCTATVWTCSFTSRGGHHDAGRQAVSVMASACPDASEFRLLLRRVEFTDGTRVVIALATDQLRLHACYASQRPIGGPGGCRNAFGSQGAGDSIEGPPAFCFDPGRDRCARRHVAAALLIRAGTSCSSPELLSRGASDTRAYCRSRDRTLRDRVAGAPDQAKT